MRQENMEDQRELLREVAEVQKGLRVMEGWMKRIVEWIEEKKLEEGSEEGSESEEEETESKEEDGEDMETGKDGDMQMEDACCAAMEVLCLMLPLFSTPMI